MKRIIRQYLGSVVSLWLTTLLISGFQIAGGLQTLFLAGAALTLLNWFIRPILKILFLPINLLSLGIFSWIINVIIIYILTYFFPSIAVSAWDFAGASFFGLNIPPQHFGIIATYIIVSFSISIVSSFFLWL